MKSLTSPAQSTSLKLEKPKLGHPPQKYLPNRDVHKLYYARDKTGILK
jgi:hypothetical protein